MNTITSTNNTQYQNNHNTSVKKDSEVSNKYEDRNNYTRELGDVSFEIKRDENLDPYSVSYEDYKNLNYSALETIFGKGTKELADASSLIVKTSITNDDTLNKIYFDRELELQSGGKKADTYGHTLGMIAIMYGNEEPIGTTTINLLNGELISNGNFSTTKLISNNKNSIDIFSTSDKLFEDFDKFKEYFYSDMKDGWSGNIDIKEIFNAMDEIKSLYQTKVEEKDALLEQLTKNNKPNPIESLS